MIGRLAALTLGLLLSALPAAAQLSTLETKDLRLVFLDPTHRFVTPHLARSFENSLAFEQRVFHFTPSEQVTVLLTDFSDLGNAGATAIPRDSISVKLAPLRFAYETIVANERMNFFMNHELVHVMAADEAAGRDRLFRRLFGGKVLPVAEQPETILYLYLTSPREAAPRWYHEGIAVFADTWMAGGLGRAQGAWDEMVFRSMVKDGSHFYDPLGLASEGTRIDFQEESNSYLYGARFMSWLAWEYSPDSVVQWVTRKDGSRAYYGSEFHRVFGLTLDEAWGRWVAFEKGFQEANLERIRRFATTPYEDVSPRALGSVSRAFVDLEGRRLYAGLNYPGIVGHIASISLDDGSVEKLHDVKLPSMYVVTSLARDPDTGTLFYTNDNSEYRDVVALDPASRKTRVLLKDARIGDLAFDRRTRALWGIRHLGGVCTLVRIDEPWTGWKSVHSWPYGEVVYDLDVSPDGARIALSHGAVDGTQSLLVFATESLLAGDATASASTDFGTAIPSNFVFAPDSAHLFGSSYYTGVSNIFRFDPATGALDAMSNTETGFFRPVPLEDGRLLVFRYTGEGFMPALIEPRVLEDVEPIVFLGQQLVLKHPELETWKAGAPGDVPLDSLITRRGPYRSVAEISLESVYPVVQGYKDSAAVGVRANLSDPLRFNTLALAATYAPDGSLPSDERLHLEGELRRYDWSAHALYNPADFYDLFGPTKTSRKGYSLGLGYDRTLVWDTPRKVDVTARAEYWGNLEELPGHQDVPVTSSTLFTSWVRLRDRDLRHSLGHVDEEKGRAWEVVLREDVAGGSGYFAAWGGLDLGFALPLPHSSVWVRSSTGFSPGDPDQPYSNFYFGGFGNNWVDHREVKRYREQYAFPGAEISEIAGRNYVKSMLEWNLPPVRFRRVGNAGFHATWLRPAVFTSVLATDLDDSGRRRTLANAGAQVDVRLQVLSRLEVTLSAGYAVAVEDGYKPRHEGMISLKVLQ